MVTFKFGINLASYIFLLVSTMCSVCVLSSLFCVCLLCSIYEKTPSEHLISGVTGQHTIALQKVNFPDTGE